MKQIHNDQGREIPPSFTAPVEITSELEDGYLCDLVFYIRKHIHLPDGSQVIRALGTHRQAPVGFEVILNRDWQENALGSFLPIMSYSGTVTFHSLGTSSDTLISVINTLYGTKLDPVAMANETQFTGTTLKGDPLNLEKGPVKIKLLFNGSGEDTYAELYTNIYLAEHRLEVLEKNEKYRTTLLKALIR